MPRPKSFVKNIEVDTAKQAHNCQHNPSHRLQGGDKRLKVKAGRTQEYYCVPCALGFIERDIEKLREIASKLQDSND